MSSAKTAELIEMSLSFVTWSHVGQGTMYSMGSRYPREGAVLKAKRAGPGHVVDTLRATQQEAQEMLQMRVYIHWSNLPNTTESSVCGGDAALCQITLITCYGRPM